MTERKNMYYLLGVTIKDHSAIVEDLPEIDEPYDDVWFDGDKLDDGVPQPFTYYVNEGKLLSYYSETPPLMSDRLLKALIDSGVDNIDAYNAVLHVSGEDKPVTNYKSINIIGLVSAVNEEKSEAIDLGIDVGVMSPRFFTKLKVSEDKANDLLLFRLAERVSQIVIHHSVKESLEKEFDDLKFTPV